MTITRIPFQHQLCVFSYLDERDLHFVWRSSKKLQPPASDHRLWRPFLEKRCIRLDAPDYHRRITEYFKRCGEVFRKYFSDSYPRALSACKQELQTRQYLIDKQGQRGNGITLSEGRYGELTTQHLDIYDIFAKFVHNNTNSAKHPLDLIFYECLNQHQTSSRCADNMRYLLALGLDPTKQLTHSNDGPLEHTLRQRPHDLETLQVLWQYPASNPAIIERRKASLPRLLKFAAQIGSRDTFQFIWSLYPYPIPASNSLGDCDTLGRVFFNRNLASDGEIIKTLLDAKAEISEDHPVWDDAASFLHHHGMAWIRGSFNCALLQYCAPATMQLLLDAGAKPNATVIENDRPILGSIDTALYSPTIASGQVPSCDCIRWLLSLGAPLSRPCPEWPGTVQFARNSHVPYEIMQLLEEAARIQFGAEEKKSSPPPSGDAAEPVAPQEMPPIAAVEPMAQPLPEPEVIVLAPAAVANPLPSSHHLDQPQNRAQDSEPSLFEQLLPQWLWRILQPIGQFINSLFSRIMRGA
ncbi:MAG: hypothetical protein ACHQT8_03335 [Chlamydiales bacterium]